MPVKSDNVLLCIFEGRLLAKVTGKLVQKQKQKEQAAN